MFHASFSYCSDAFDTEKLLRVVEKLKQGQAVDIPKYDFKSYKNDVFPLRRVNIHSMILFCFILLHTSSNFLKNTSIYVPHIS